MELDLNVIRFVRLIVRIGERLEVGANGLSDVNAGKGYLHRSTADQILIAHGLTCFQGGSVSLVRSGISGSTRTIPAGNV